MYTIKNPLKDYLKYPSYSKSKIKEPAINTLFNLEKSLEHFNSLGENKEKNYHWRGTEMIQHLYHNYLFDKYGVKCRLNVKKIKELDIKQNKLTQKSELLRHSLHFSYGIKLKLYKFKNTFEEEESEIFYKQYLDVLSESLVNCLLLNKNKILPFIVELSGLGHANLIIFRTNTFVAEVFEPHGQEYRGLISNKKIEIKKRYSELIQSINNIL